MGGGYWRSKAVSRDTDFIRHGVNGVLIIKEIVDNQRADVVYCWERSGKITRNWGESPSDVMKFSTKEGMGCNQWNGNPRWATFHRDKNGKLTLSFSLFRFNKGDPRLGIDSEIKWEFRFENGKLAGVWMDSAREWGEVVSEPGVVSLWDNRWHVTMERLPD